MRELEYECRAFGLAYNRIETRLALNALNMLERVQAAHRPVMDPDDPEYSNDDPTRDLPGGRWCEECGCSTNHTTQQHLDAEADGPQEG